MFNGVVKIYAVMSVHQIRSVCVLWQHDGLTSEQMDKPSPTQNERGSMSCMEKYRGIAPKKSLVSKDHEHAYFDSADWVDLSMIIKRKKTICTNQFIMPVCTNRFIMYACTNQFYNVDARKNSELKERTQQFLPLQQLHSMFSNKDTTPRRTM
ncbi:hypothetical protein ZEAMMB73_Zm00001d046036 [Zea mays]|nr:hypothetical protein ZEAMMB73_Zm00001d046036 [Zea mays]